MSLAELVSAVSSNCLHGKPVPHALHALWRARESGDHFIADACGLALLSSLEPLRVGYEPADPDPAVAANCRAHRRLWERLGFFAAERNGGFLAFDLQAEDSRDPPVVHLDSEGTYEWAGKNLAEAVFRQAEDLGTADAARAWLGNHGLELAELLEIGASTQFLPSLRMLHERLYWESCGHPRASIPDSVSSAIPEDPLTWMLRPAAEVKRVVGQLPGMTGNGLPQSQWFRCDEDGRIVTVWLPFESATSLLKVRGVAFRTSRSAVSAKLGEATSEGKHWLRYDSGLFGTHFEFDRGGVSKITLMVVPPSGRS